MILIMLLFGIWSRDFLGPEFRVMDTGFFKTPDLEGLGKLLG